MESALADFLPANSPLEADLLPEAPPLAGPPLAAATLTEPPLPESLEFVGCWGRDFDAEPRPMSWLWDGFLAPANVTLMTSQWKSGKTTLLSILLGRMRLGGTLAERNVRQCQAVVVSEEPENLWRGRHERLDLGNAHFLCLPFRGKPTSAQWQGLLDHVRSMASEHNIRLLAIDSLSTFLPGRSESCAPVLMEALLPVRGLAERGIAVLLTHHPAKGDPLPGQAARGSGALASFTDINMEMSWYKKCDTTDRRRRILTHSRHADTPRQLVLELNADGTDYLVRGDFSSDEFSEGWQRLQMVLEDARGKLTRREIRADWPQDYACPSDTTLFRWLTRGVGTALICQEGTGRRADPFRYWLPGREKIWRKDPMYLLSEKMEQSRRLVEKELGWK